MRLVARLCLGACCFLCASASSFAQDETVQIQKLTEIDAIARLMTSDPRVRALGVRVDEVRAVQAERVLWPNPSVVYAREGVTDIEDVFVLARQELPMSGRRAHLRTAGRLAVDAARADVRSETVQLQAEVRHAFTMLLLAQARETVLKDGVDELRQLVGLLRVREQEGEGSRYDRMRGERALIDLEADLAASMAATTQARGRLAGYLGPGVLPSTLVAEGSLESAAPPPLAVLVEQALANRADYQATAITATRFEAEREAASRLRVPTPIVTGGMKRSGLGDVMRSGYVFTFDLSLPVFNRGQSTAAAASAQAARAEAEAASLRVRIEAEVRAAHAALGLYQERAVQYRRSVAETVEPLATIGRVGYEEGELGILELLDANRQALEGRVRALELIAAARIAAIDLDRMIGTEITP